MRWKVRSFLAALMALGTLSILATQLHIKPAAAVAFGEDDRRAVARTKGTEGGAIGLVFYQAAGGQFAAGTGFLVSPCHVLTAYHVAAGGERVDETTASTFYVGDGKIGPDFPDLNRFAESSPAHPVLWGRYVRLNDESNLLVRAQSVERNGWEDWALLELDKCFGAKPYSYGYLKLAPVSTREIMKGGANIAARSVGLPGDKSAKSLWEDPTCRLIGQIYASGWQHDCITIPGNSGGPILIKDPVTNEQRVAAITVSHIAVEGLAVDASDALVLGRDDPNYYDYLAIAVPVASLIERISPYLVDDARVQGFLARQKNDDHYRSNDSEQAIADLGTAIAADPKKPELYVLRAIWNRYAGRDDNARVDLAQTLALDTDFAPARYLRGRMELEEGDAESLKIASGDFSAIATRHADSPDVLLYRGITENRASSYDKAIADFDLVLKRQPKSAVAVNERGDAWKGLRNYERALADYSKAIGFAGDWPEAYRDRGYLYHLLARHEEARGDFNRAIKLNAPRCRGVERPRAGVAGRGAHLRGAQRLQPRDRADAAVRRLSRQPRDRAADRRRRQARGRGFPPRRAARARRAVRAPAAVHRPGARRRPGGRQDRARPPRRRRQGRQMAAADRRPVPRARQHRGGREGRQGRGAEEGRRGPALRRRFLHRPVGADLRRRRGGDAAPQVGL